MIVNICQHQHHHHTHCPGMRHMPHSSQVRGHLRPGSLGSPGPGEVAHGAGHRLRVTEPDSAARSNLLGLREPARAPNKDDKDGELTVKLLNIGIFHQEVELKPQMGLNMIEASEIQIESSARWLQQKHIWCSTSGALPTDVV